MDAGKLLRSLMIVGAFSFPFLPKSAWAGEVVIPDPVLNAAVRQALGIPAPTPILEEDMACLDVLWVRNPGVGDLTGLEHAVNLSLAVLTHGSIADLSPLTNLSNLSSLDVTDNAIADLRPVEHLPKLRALDFAQNNVTNLAPLATMTQLGKLDLSRNPVSDLSALMPLASSLSSLYLSGLSLSDLSGFGSFSGLHVLDISENDVSDIQPIASMLELGFLAMAKNQVADISPLASLEHLEHAQLCDNVISDISPLAGLSRLEWLDLSSNPLSREAYDIYIPQILRNNPGIGLIYDPIPEPLTGSLLGLGLMWVWQRRSPRVGPGFRSA
jgi:hypothetical protein